MYDAKVENHHRFRVRPYGVRWLVYDGKTGRIAEFYDSKGLAVQLAAILSGQLSQRRPGGNGRMADEPFQAPTS